MAESQPGARFANTEDDYRELVRSRSFNSCRRTVGAFCSRIGYPGGRVTGASADRAFHVELDEP